MTSRMPLPWRMGRRILARPSTSAPVQLTPRIARQQVPRRLYSSHPPRPNKSQVKFWPFFAIIGLGSAGYIGLVNRRKDVPSIGSSEPAGQPVGQLAQPSKPVPTFSSTDVTVLFVLGGPGAGKGTQCAKLVSEHGFTHLSAGDLLRAEQERPGSEFGDLIRDYIKDGLIVPMEVTVQLLENAMTDALSKAGSKKGRFLIDGFPRKMDQAHKFEDTVCPAKLVLFYDCPEETMQKRLMERGKTSGRADDNAESIRKRFRTFVETSMPVVDYFEKEGKLVKLDATASPDNVFDNTKKSLKERLGSEF